MKARLLHRENRTGLIISLITAKFILWFLVYLYAMWYCVHSFLTHRYVQTDAVGAGIIVNHIHRRKIAPVVKQIFKR